MAFNPFQSFRKHQKFWMATILLLCMLTFVLCTGVGGDLSDIILNATRSSGTKSVGTINGSTVYYSQLEQLRAQRKLADSYMKKACELALDNLAKLKKGTEEELKKYKKTKEKLPKDLAQRRSLIFILMKNFEKRLEREHYFGGDSTLDGLFNFLAFQREADRLGIDLVEDSVRQLTFYEILPPVGMGREVFSQRDLDRTAYVVLQEYRNEDLESLNHALKEEFRVEMARLALIAAQQQKFNTRLMRPNVKPAPRALLSPAQLKSKFIKDRRPFDVAMVPVRVESFLDQVGLPPVLARVTGLLSLPVGPLPAAAVAVQEKAYAPSEKQLETLFEEYKSASYDPDSPTPGFQIPQRVKVSWIMGDPTTDYYQRLAKAATQFETTPPAWIPSFSPLTTAVRYAAGPVALTTSLERNYRNLKINRETRLAKYGMVPVTVDAFLPIAMYYRGKPTAQSVASLVTAGTGPLLLSSGAGATASFVADVYQNNKKSIDEFRETLRKAEKQRRAVLRAKGVRNALLGTLSGEPIIAAAILDKLFNKKGMERLFGQQYLPLAAVREEVLDRRLTQLASTWIKSKMETVLGKLKKLEGSPNRFRFEAFKLKEKYHLRSGQTDYVDRYSLEKSNALKPLKERYEAYLNPINLSEGRGANVEKLTEENFYRLFFDNKERHSIAGEPYRVQTWPPTDVLLDRNQVAMHANRLREGKAAEILAELRKDPKKRTVNLFQDALKPMIFWKTDDQPSLTPKSLKADSGKTREQVERAWRFLKARQEYAIPVAKQVAFKLATTTRNYTSLLERAAFDLGERVIRARGISKLMPMQANLGGGPGITYEKYAISDGYKNLKQQLDRPVDDFPSQLLKLKNLKQPIKTGIKAIDRINKQLFKRRQGLETEDIGKHIQILTNRPQTVFYVAVVEHTTPVSVATQDFIRGYTNALAQNLYPDIALAEFGDEYRDAIIKAVRERLKVEPDESQASNFDSR